MEVEQPGRRDPVGALRGRTTDGAEDAVAWLLVSLALLGALVGFGVGREAHADTVARSVAERAEPVRVRAVLVEVAREVGPVDGVAPSWTRPVRARWTPPGGTAVIGFVPVTGPRSAGDAVAVWVDRGGRVVAAPVTEATATVEAWSRGTAVALVGWGGLGLVWLGVRRATAARNAVRWGRDWARVEPVWSGRAG